MRDVYWDSVLIGDDEIPHQLIDSAIECYNKTSFEKGVIDGMNESKYSYEAISTDLDGYSKNILEYLLSSGAIPVLDGHSVRNVIKAHKLIRGDKFDWHCDGSYSIAVSVYLSECEGGELQIKNPLDDTKSLMVAPIKNRYVVMKCDNMHRINEVKSGERKSIQIFITYMKDD